MNPATESGNDVRALLDRLDRGEVPSHLPAVVGDAVPADADVAVWIEYPDLRSAGVRDAVVTSTVEHIVSDRRRRFTAADGKAVKL